MSEENKLNATTHQAEWNTFIDALEQSQLQNEAALVACRLRAVKHRKSAAGLAGAHPGLQGRILLNYTRKEKPHKIRKKTLDFLLFTKVQQTFCFSFSLLRHYQMPECFYFNNCCFWARATVLSCYRNL